MNLAECARRRLDEAKMRLDDLDESCSSEKSFRESDSAEDVIFKKIEEQHRLHRELLGPFKSVSELEEANGALQGTIRGLEFAITVYREQKAALERKLASSEGVEELEARLKAAWAEDQQLAIAVAVAEEELANVRSRCTVRLRTESEREELRKEDSELDVELGALRNRLRQVQESCIGEDAIAKEKSLLREKTQQLLSELRELEKYQTAACEARMDLLGFCIEKEELLLRVFAKKRELVELTQFSSTTAGSSMEPIPEEYPVVQIDFESEDIEVRQAELRAQHESVREVNEMRTALNLRIQEVEGELQQLII